ncbi:DUF2341 domain-containing protein [Methanococcus maripaludis]|uniref:DUF2341 domain-containing protein n=1 Tax=Methanococcus maripaludis TaxID=39152 RepID=A0A7J9PMI5_METMI|nr:DUF2341 domain-containing protein [Methanococcus maripaludis]MBA2863994.1 hypothetical protein [Methanococcus maripaludis]
MKTKPLIVLLLLFGSLIPASVLAAEPTGHTYRIQTVYYSQDAITGYSTYLDIDTTTLKTELPSEWQNQTKVYNADLDTDCYHYIEEINSTYYRIWFKTNFLSGNNHINFYIGGTENIGNEDEVFQYYNESITISNIEYDWSNDFETNDDHMDGYSDYTRQLDGSNYIIYGDLNLGVDLTESEILEGRLDFQLKTTDYNNAVMVDYKYSSSTTTGPHSTDIMNEDEWYNCSLIWDCSGSQLYVNDVQKATKTTHPGTGLNCLWIRGDYLYLDNISYTDFSGTTYADYINLTTISSDSELLADVNLKNDYSNLAIISNTGEIIEEFSNQVNGTYSEISLSNLAVKNISYGVWTYPYWTETTSKAWAKLDLVAGVPKKILVGKGGTTARDGENTFLLFDDFSGSSLDTEKWDTAGSGSVTVADGVCTLIANDNSAWRSILSKDQYSNFKIMAKGQFQTQSGEDGRTLIYAMSDGTYTGYGLDGIFGQMSDRDNNIQIRVDSTAVQSSSVTVDKLIDYRIEFIKNDTDFAFNTDLGNLSTTSSAYSQGYLGIAMSEGKAVIEFIAVGKSISTEPTVSEPTIIDANTVEFTITSSETVTGYQVALDISDLSLSSVDDYLIVCSAAGYGFETINETEITLSTNTEYEISQILKENEIKTIIGSSEVSAEKTGYGLLSLAGLNDVELSNVKIRKWAENPPTLSASTLPYLVGNDQDTDVVKTLSLFDESDLSLTFYNALTGDDLYNNITVIFTGNAALKEYTFDSDDFASNNSIDLTVPSYGSVAISDDRGFVRQITYEETDTEIDLTYPNNESSLIEWYILVDSASNVVTIKDSRTNVLQNATGSDTHSFYGIFGRTYKIYVDGVLEATDTMSTAKSFDFRTDPSAAYLNTTSGDIIDYTPVTLPTHPDITLVGGVQNDTINITYVIEGPFSSLDLLVRTTNNTELYSETLYATQNTILISGVDNDSTYVAQTTLHEVEGGILVNTYIITPEYPNAGLFSSAKNIFGETWSNILAILLIFIILLSFSKVHMFAGSVAAVVTIVSLNFAGYLDFMSPITKAVVLLLAVLPAIIESR